MTAREATEGGSRRYGCALALAVLAGGGALVSSYLRHGVSALDEPWAVEAFVAQRLRQLAIPRAERDRSNPVEPGEQVLAEARAHYADHCAVCHAADGSGDTAVGRGLYPPVPDMRADATQRLTEGELFWIIRNGVRFTGMPGWGRRPPDEDVETWGLVHLVRRLPRLDPDEQSELERLLPRTRSDLANEAAERAFLEGGEAPVTGDVR